MKIHNMPQGSEEWERIRRGKATASRFSEILTPAKLQLAAASKTYAVELAAEILGVNSPDPMPSYWEDRGTELEPYALNELAEKVGTIERIGFVEGDGCGFSPDGFVGEDAIVEVKCPKAETLIKWIAAGELPTEHSMQIQGGLWLTKRKLCHFWAWHPEIEPLHILVTRNELVIDSLEREMPRFVQSVRDIVAKVKTRKATIIVDDREDRELEGFDD